MEPLSSDSADSVFLDPQQTELFPSPEGATTVMDTTFYYALYVVLFAGTIVGNFFLVSQAPFFLTSV